MQKKVLMAFDDPGGGLAVSSLTESLERHDKIKLEIYAGRLSKKFIDADKHYCNNIESTITKEEANGIINRVIPDIIITGTGGGNAEQELRNVALEKGIRSIVIMDFWKDYSRRWLYASYGIPEMKDLVCIMDEPARDEMLIENFPVECLAVTGHPYLDKIFNYNKSKSQKPAKENQILFLSQPLKILGAADHKIHPLEILLQGLKKLSLEKRSVIDLMIRLHPSESMTSEVKELADKYNSNEVAVNFTDSSRSLNELIAGSEIVIGYNTIAMFESRALHRRTISLKAAPMKNSLIKAMQQAGIEFAETDPEELFGCIMNKAETANKSSGEKLFEGGINNCMNIILRELNLN